MSTISNNPQTPNNYEVNPIQAKSFDVKVQNNYDQNARAGFYGVKEADAKLNNDIIEITLDNKTEVRDVHYSYPFNDEKPDEIRSESYILERTSISGKSIDLKELEGALPQEVVDDIRQLDKNQDGILEEQDLKFTEAQAETEALIFSFKQGALDAIGGAIIGGTVGSFFPSGISTVVGAVAGGLSTGITGGLDAYDEALDAYKNAYDFEPYKNINTQFLSVR